MWRLAGEKRWRKSRTETIAGKEANWGRGEGGGGEVMWEEGNDQSMLHTCTRMSKWCKLKWKALFFEANMQPNVICIINLYEVFDWIELNFYHLIIFLSRNN